MPHEASASTHRCIHAVEDHAGASAFEARYFCRLFSAAEQYLRAPPAIFSIPVPPLRLLTVHSYAEDWLLGRFTRESVSLMSSTTGEVAGLEVSAQMNGIRLSESRTPARARCARTMCRAVQMQMRHFIAPAASWGKGEGPRRAVGTGAGA
jgi:hypothetical protein